MSKHYEQYYQSFSTISPSSNWQFLTSQNPLEVYNDLNKDQKSLVQSLVPLSDIIIYASIISKINKRGTSQKRIIVITNRSVYNIVPQFNRIFNLMLCSSSSCPIRRKIYISNVFGITLSTDIHSKRREFILHIRGEYDYRFDAGSNIDKVIRSILRAYFANTLSPFVFYLRSETNLAKFHTIDDDLQAKIDKRPPSNSIVLITPEIVEKGLEWVIANREFLVLRSHPNSLQKDQINYMDIDISLRINQCGFEISNSEGSFLSPCSNSDINQRQNTFSYSPELRTVQNFENIPSSRFDQNDNLASLPKDEENGTFKLLISDLAPCIVNEKVEIKTDFDTIFLHRD